MNPSGSMKDRMALQIIDDAEKSKKIKKGDTLIVLTSGNGGISLATVSAAKGYRLIVTMSEGNSPERQRIIRALGAELILVPQLPGSIEGQVSGKDLEKVDKVTSELGEKLNVFRIDQFLNEGNPKGYERAGHEIWTQSDGEIDSFVDFVGTGGSFTGVSRALKSHDSKIRCYAVEPASAPYLAGGNVTNIGHKIQGGGYSRSLALFDRSLCDGFLSVSDGEAISCARKLGKVEGILAGFSSGANVSASLKVASQHKSIATLLPDSGMRYLSTDLYE